MIGGTTITNTTNGKGGESETMRIRNDEVANILLSFNRKNKLDNSCNDEDEKNSDVTNMTNLKLT